MPERYAPGLHRFAVLTAGATFVLLFAGALVTSTGSALAVPDWPLAFGQFFPRMEGGVLFEHGHRLKAAFVGSLTLVLAVWVVLRESRPAVRVLGLLALFTVVLQGVLGGITVLYRLPLAVSVAHACLGQVFFCLTVTLAVVTARAWIDPPTRLTPSMLPTLATVTTGLVGLQLVLGALVRHTGAGLAIPDFPLAFGRVVPPLATPFITIHFAHRVGAVVVAAGVLTTAWVTHRAHVRQRWLLRPALLAVALMATQVALGATIIWTQRAVVSTSAHVVVGAALLACSLVLTLRAHRLIATQRRLVTPGLLAHRAVA